MVEENFAFLRRRAPDDEVAAIHVEADSFDAETAKPLRIAVTRVKGARILTGHACDITCGDVVGQDQIIRLLRHIGGRPVIGFFVDFSMALLNRLAEPLVGGPLPNQRVEVSSLYYEYKPKNPGKNVVNLRLAHILQDLQLPPRPTAGAIDSATSSALIWLRLRQRRYGK